MSNPLLSVIAPPVVAVPRGALWAAAAAAAVWNALPALSALWRLMRQPASAPRTAGHHEALS